MKPYQLSTVARICGLGTALAIASPEFARADFFAGQQSLPCGALCDQSVTFSPANSGTTVIGDTNPAPVYDVFIDSLEGLTLHASGSTVDTGVGGPGFSSIVIRPASPYAWTYIEFTMHPMLSVTPPQSGLTLTIFDQNNLTHVFSANFPWESNQGDNQHYFAQATNGDLITKLQIDYVDPTCTSDCTPNTIQDIHNIDVASTTIPEPASMALFGVGLLGLAAALRRRTV